MTRLQGRVAFVTGAGRGIGRGIALALAREGAALVNNAAWTPTPGLLLADFDDATFGRVLATHLWATFWCMQAARPHLVRRGKGSIINFASGSGTKGQETQGAYAAAKEGIRGLSRVAAREWEPDGIRVNVICPFANSRARAVCRGPAVRARGRRARDGRRDVGRPASAAFDRSR